MRVIMEFIFGCQHRNITWPMGRGHNTSVVCLNCFQRFRYDWRNMKVAEPFKELDVAPVLEMDRGTHVRLR